MINKLLPIVIGITLTTFNTTASAKSTIGAIVFTNISIKDVEVIDAVGNVSSSEKGTEIVVPNNSRIRVRWENEDGVSVYTEFAIKNDGNTVRHAYGTWNIDEKSQLLAGQTSTPFAPLNPNVAMVNNSGDHYGNISAGRKPQIRYTYKFPNRQGAMAIALVDPKVSNAPNDAASETSLPRIDVGLAYKTFNWQIFPSLFVAKQSFAGESNVTATGLSLGAKTAINAITFAAEIGGGKNWGNTSQKVGNGSTSSNGSLFNSANAAKSGDDDANVLQYWIDVGYRFTGKETKGAIHLVYGSSNVEKGNTIDTKSTMLGISVPIDFPWIARGFRLRPEMFTFKDEDNKSSIKKTNTIAGVQLQYTF